MVAAMARSRAGFFPIRSAFPGLATGRRPHCRFRGLLELYTRYGLPDRSPTIRGLCRGVPARPVSRTGRPPAIEFNHQLFEWVLPPLGISPFGAHARPPALPGVGFLPLLPPGHLDGLESAFGGGGGVAGEAIEVDDPVAEVGETDAEGGPARGTWRAGPGRFLRRRPR